jgi:hypothetical protein
MRIANNFPLVVDGSLDGNLTSPLFHVHQGWIGAIQAVWTGAPIGSLELLISNDGFNFSVYTGSVTVVSGPGNFMWNLAVLGFNYLQVNYTFGSGTGTINISANYKGIV